MSEKKWGSADAYSASNYWPELVLNWLQKKPEHIDSDVLYWIENLIKDKNKYSQKVRHLAIKMRKDFLERFST